MNVLFLKRKKKKETWMTTAVTSDIVFIVILGKQILQFSWEN